MTVHEVREILEEQYKDQIARIDAEIEKHARLGDVECRVSDNDMGEHGCRFITERYIRLGFTGYRTTSPNGFVFVWA